MGLSSCLPRKVFVCPVMESIRMHRVGQEISTRSWTMHGNNWVLADKRRDCTESGRFGCVRTWNGTIDVVVKGFIVF
jgi:hypothetical protein